MLRVHVKQSSHNIQWGEANVLAREGHWTKRNIKEGIHVHVAIKGEELESR